MGIKTRGKIELDSTAYLEWNPVNSTLDLVVDGSTVAALGSTTPVTLPTALFRSSRARLASPAAAAIYFYEGGTRTNTNTHLVIPAGEIQTQKASTTI